jgi:N-methylhydantoinase A
VPLSQVDLGRVRGLMSELRDEATKELGPTGLSDTDVDVGLFTQMCYPGQNFDMSVPVPEGTAIDDPGLLDLAERFHDQHQAERGFAFRNQQPLLRGVRLVARGNTPKPDHLAELGSLDTVAGAQVGTRPAFFDGSFLDTPVFDGTRLGPGTELPGPALVEEPFTVLVVPPGGRARLGDTGNYELRLT